MGFCAPPRPSVAHSQIWMQKIPHPSSTFSSSLLDFSPTIHTHTHTHSHSERYDLTLLLLNCKQMPCISVPAPSTNQPRLSSTKWPPYPPREHTLEALKCCTHSVRGIHSISIFIPSNPSVLIEHVFNQD